MAQRFTFKLQVLLDIRQAERKRCQRLVAQRVQSLHRLQDERQQLQQQATEALHEALRAAAGDRLDVAHLARQRYWSSQLQQQVLGSGLRISQEQRRLEAERADLARAATAARIVEKLRERQLARHVEHVERVLRREADEMAVQHSSWSRPCLRH
jgi:flagellar FliJ protein